MTEIRSVQVGDLSFVVMESKDEEEPLLIDIHGDNWCTVGNDRISDFVYDPILFSKRRVFGFPLDE